MTIPYGGDSLWTTIKLEKPPDFGFIVTLAWKNPFPTMLIIPNVVSFDSGEYEKTFTIRNIGDYEYNNE